MLFKNPRALGVASGGAGGGTIIPSGVFFQAIDGGPTYHATNGFTKATAFPVSTPYPTGTVPYTNGWDDPKFFHIGIGLSGFNSQTDANRWLDIGLNVADSPQSSFNNTQLDLFLNNGISLIVPYQAMKSFMNPAYTRDPGAETVGIYTFDEPPTDANALYAPITGIPASTFLNCTTDNPGFNRLTINGTVTGGAAFWMGATGTPWAHATLSGSGITGSGTTAEINGYSTGRGGGGGGSYSVNFTDVVTNITITQAAVPPLTAALIGGRFLSTGFNGAQIPRFQNIATQTGNIAFSQFLKNTYTDATGNNKRRIETMGQDFFFFVSAFNATTQLQCANIYGANDVPGLMTNSDVAKGTHYGTLIDYQRKMQDPTYSFPIWAVLDNCNGNVGVAYTTQPVEMNWSSWSTIIHGSRGIIWFPDADFLDPSGCWAAGFGTDVFQCPFMQSAATASITASISGTTLTVSAVASGIVAPGMVSTAGVTGQIVILQQTSNVTSAPGKVATYKIAVLSGAGTGSGSMTLQQTNIGTGGYIGSSTGSFSFIGMYDFSKKIHQRVRDMAQVINSPFAVQDVGGSLGYLRSTSPTLAYVFPSDTGWKNSFPPQNLTYGNSTGIDCCVKLYSGSNYLASTGDTISAGFYIFATTRFTELSTAISVSFVINDPAATSITVIGEGRTINFSSGQGTSSATFSDTFDFAWTVRIYRVNQ